MTQRTGVVFAVHEDTSTERARYIRRVLEGAFPGVEWAVVPGESSVTFTYDDNTETSPNRKATT